MKLIKKSYLLLILILSLLTFTCLFSACSSDNQTGNALLDKEGKWPPEPANIHEIQLTTFPVPGGDSLEAVLADTDFRAPEPKMLRVNLQEGGFGTLTPWANATLRQRGRTTRYSKLKSFKIKLDSSVNLWRGNRVLNLNKHPYDMTCVRNKLSFDLMSGVPHLLSLDTRFVHLFIDGQDAGLYTHVENVNRRFLRRLRLNSDAPLYKAEYFEFERYEGSLKLNNDPTYDEKEFQKVLEIKGSRDHQPLINMLDALEDYDQPINQILATYFDMDNYLNWLSVNILIGNYDTTSQNFYLYYSPEIKKWFFIPWDYDGGWDFYNQPAQRENHQGLGRWQQGLAYLWTVQLHRRFLREPGNLEKLLERMKFLHQNYLTKERINALLQSYYPLVKPFTLRKPDRSHIPFSETSWSNDTNDEEFDSEFYRLAEVIDDDYQKALDFLAVPMAVYLVKPQLTAENKVKFKWTESFDFQGDPLVYDLIISGDKHFSTSEILLRHNDITSDHIEIDLPHRNRDLFWRIIVRDDKGNWQQPFDDIWDEEEDRMYFGLMKFNLPETSQPSTEE